MESMNILVSSLVLSSVLVVSVAALYAVIARHVQLSPSAAMDSAVVDRFDSEVERAAFHADLEAAQEARSSAVMARYRRIMDSELGARDPRMAQEFRRASFEVPDEDDEAVDGAVQLNQASASTQLSAPDRSERPAPQPRRAPLNGNGSSAGAYRDGDHGARPSPGSTHSARSNT